MRLVLRERGADHAWITTGDSASDAIRPRPQRLADQVEPAVSSSLDLRKNPPKGKTTQSFAPQLARLCHRLKLGLHLLDPIALSIQR